MAVVLGLHFGHDGSACIVKDGKLIAAISSERLYRHKKSFGVFKADLDYLFSATGITINDIDVISLTDYFHNAVHDSGVMVTRNGRPVEHCLETVFDNDMIDFDVEFRGKKLRGLHICHQLAHCASAYYTSPFEKAYCFSMDSSGGKLKNNSLIAKGEGRKLTAMYCPGLMVGNAYGDFTEKLGLGCQMFKAGTLMALASYGHINDEVRTNIKRYIADSFITLDSLHHAWMKTLWEGLSCNSDSFDPNDKDSKKAMDIAATIQFIFEQAILHCVNSIDSQGIENLCLSGGSMLNCNANSTVLRNGNFKNIHLFPACSDDGCAVGSALYIAHNYLGEPRCCYTDQEIAYLGPDRPCAEPDCAFVAKQLSEGKIVAWCNGRAEYGPRALGNRSILADPRFYANRERINFKIKDREWFRPLAPVVLAEDLEEWFDFQVLSPFMLFTAMVKKPKEVPAIVHIDGTARMQTITREMNPYYYDIVSEFKKLTGVPMLINTSLNVNGEPLVERDEDAWNFWNKTPVDLMVLNGEINRR